MTIIARKLIHMVYILRSEDGTSRIVVLASAQEECPVHTKIDSLRSACAINVTILVLVSSFAM